MSQNFDSLVDLLQQSMTQPNQEVAQQTPDIQKQAQAAQNLSDEQLAELGFDERQVSWIKGTIKDVAEQTATTVLRTNHQKMTLAQAQREYDIKAETDFPDLKNKNSRLYQVTQEVIRKKAGVDPHASTRPDLVYSSVLEAQRQLGYNASNSGSNTTNMPHRNTTYRGFTESSSMPSASTSQSNNGQVSERRQWVKQKLGRKV